MLHFVVGRPRGVLAVGGGGGGGGDGVGGAELSLHGWVCYHSCVTVSIFEQ